MVIEINLLPQKVKKNATPFLVVIVLLLLISLFTYVIYEEKRILTTQMKALDNQISLIKSKEEQVSMELTKAESSTAVEQLSKIITFTDDISISSVNVLQHLVSLLPDRGFLMNFGYSDAGDINVTVQFDTSREAAYYLKTLQDSIYIADVTITSLVTSTVAESANEFEYIPRYIGQFTILLNKEELHKLNRKEGE